MSSSVLLPARTFPEDANVSTPAPTAHAPLRRLAALALCALFSVTIGCSAFGRAVKEGDDFSTQHKWAEAEAAYLRAMAADPDASEVTIKLRGVRKSWSEEVYQEAERTHTAGDLPGAQKLLLRALELDGDNELARTLLTRTLDARVEAAQKALKEERLQDARTE